MAPKRTQAKLDRMLDVRVRDRYLADKSIDDSTVKKYIDSLEDCAEIAEYVDLPSVEREEDDASGEEKPADG
jgi:hypothetical protein